MPDIKKTVTSLLNDVRQGNHSALDKLLPIVYGELRKQAAGYMWQERSGHTLQATELVNEAYLKLIGQDKTDFKNREHFLGVAAMAMRQILVDYSRRHKAQKRGGGAQKITLYEDKLVPGNGVVEIMALDEALKTLEKISPRQCKIVELRYFTGLKNEEIARLLNISEATVKRDWRLAKAWLFSELNKA